MISGTMQTDLIIPEQLLISLSIIDQPIKYDWQTQRAEYDGQDQTPHYGTVLNSETKCKTSTKLVAWSDDDDWDTK